MDAVLSRRSIRKYTAEPVSDGAVKYLLECAMAAPSAHNQQPWHFVVIRNRDTLDQIPRFHPFSQMLRQAPLAILVLGEEALCKAQPFWVQDCSAATENILIGAQSLGLGAVWLGIYPAVPLINGIRRLLAIPEDITPFALVAIGHPAEQKPPSNRYNESRVHYEKW